MESDLCHNKLDIEFLNYDLLNSMLCFFWAYINSMRSEKDTISGI